MRTAKIALGFAAAVSIAASAFAQSYPIKSVRVIIPFTPGSGIDIIGRSVSQKLSEMWGQPVVVENRTGAGGTVGAGVVAKSPADGYTLLVNSNAHTVTPALYSSLPYDTLKDFVEIAPLANLGQVLVVSPSAGVKSVSELIAAAKARPGQLTFASPGTGSGLHFTGEMMGRVTYWITSIGTALPFIQGGKLLALGVTTRQRSALLPDVPPIAEAGVAGFEDSLWFGMWARVGTPSDIVNKVATDISRTLAAPDLRDQFRKLAAEPMNMTPTEFARFVRSETDAAAR